MTIELCRIGIFRGATPTDGGVAAEVEKLGYGAIWLGGSPRGDLKVIEDLLDATDHVVVATGIANIWMNSADAIAKAFHRINDRHPNWFLLGVGAGHPETSRQYGKPCGAWWSSSTGWTLAASRSRFAHWPCWARVS